MKLLALADGKKTYAIVILGLALGAWQGLYDYHFVHEAVPSWLTWALGFAGLGTARMGIQTQAKNTTENVIALVQAVLGQIEVPQPQTVTVAGRTITVGKPSGSLTPEQEAAETAALNKSQVP